MEGPPPLFMLLRLHQRALVSPCLSKLISTMASHPPAPDRSVCNGRVARRASALQRCQQTMRNIGLLHQAPLHLLVRARGHCILHPAPHLKNTSNPPQQYMRHPLEDTDSYARAKARTTTLQQASPTSDIRSCCGHSKLACRYAFMLGRRQECRATPRARQQPAAVK